MSEPTTNPQGANQFQQMEEEVLTFWDKAKIFEQSVEREAPQGDYVFYDGPPFGTGEPHYGHILSSVSKDVVPRYWTMQGYRVERRWGWDCHGLPIENIIEADMKISGKKQIEEMGVAVFNEACRSRVLEYADIWDGMVRRIGRWVDFKNSYKTMDTTFMESVWWGFKELWNKDLIYEGRKVLLYCPRCETPISNFEVAMDNSYKDVTDSTLYVKFKAINAKEKLGLDGDVYVMAWTTTPWTLPSNVALAVGENIDYVIVEDGSTYILAKERLSEVFKDKEAKIVKALKGAELLGLEYEPLLDILLPEEEQSKKAYYVVPGDFVTTDDGTGIVHIAPVYGEDDYKLGQKFELPIIPTLDEKGHFTQTVPEFTGLYFKKANELIINKLTERGSVFANVKVSHSYPHCHRCDTALFYNAIPAWFLNIAKIRGKMLENNQKVNWYPEHLKDGRFAKGIEQAPDWNISRNRYFATPIPIWRCEECGEMEVVGSVEELEQKSGASEISDIHNHNIDHLAWKCSKCSHEMKRIKEVFDCWVESGSMPFAQMHYPFENEQKFKDNFPAQFISEYISQTRAWFYVMHAISTGLFDSHSFENVITTGVILNEKGEKMSKSKKNYPDPYKVINEFGADALRAYLMGSTVMHAENLFFNENEVKDLFRKNIMILWNVYKFYEMYAAESRDSEGVTRNESGNVLDQWILAKLDELIEEVTKNMNAYDLPRSVRPIGDFINELSTWYIRRSRDRFKGEDEADKQAALATTGFVLAELAKVMSPFMPFIAEQVWQKVTGNNFGNDSKSVHLESWPKPGTTDKAVLGQMEAIRKIVEAGLAKRDEAGIKIRQALPHYSTDLAKELSAEYVEIIKDELNVLEVRFGANELGTEMSEELLMDGVKRELVRFINAMRKNAGLTIQDRIAVYWSAVDSDFPKPLVKKVIGELGDALAKDVLADVIKEERATDIDSEKEVKANGEPVWLGIKKI
ncbi:isoleucine--tRNA ligase [Candidatus Falkowbacteria bacterium]|nr:isoleucine--tRNA ligase [Candidatus Falkowbacteria bacterium]